MSRSTAFRFSLNDNFLTKEGRYKVGGTGIVVLIVILNKIHLDLGKVFQARKIYRVLWHKSKIIFYDIIKFEQKI